MTSEMILDAKRMLVTLWDLGPTEPVAEPDSPEYKKYEREKAAFRGPLQVEMRSVNARDAMKFDPKRYVTKLPKGVKPGPAHEEMLERKQQEAAEFENVLKRDPMFAGAPA